jgi:hypothetical protein
MTDIYVVEHTEDRERMSRFVVVANGADDARAFVAMIERINADDLEVGRLGPYEPGTVGASMSRGTYIAVQRSGQPHPGGVRPESRAAMSEQP